MLARRRPRFFEFFMVPVRNKNTRIVYYHAIGEFLAWSQRCRVLVWKTSKCIPCRAQTTGYATAQSGALFLGRRGCEILLPLSFRWQPNIATTQSQRRHPTMGEHFPTPPSPSLPALQLPQSRCRSFPALLQLALVSLSSRIKPLLEMCLEALEHLFFYVFDVGEPVPTSDIAVFTGTLKFQNEFFH